MSCIKYNSPVETLIITCSATEGILQDHHALIPKHQFTYNHMQAWVSLLYDYLVSVVLKVTQGRYTASIDQPTFVAHCGGREGWGGVLGP